MIILFPLSPSHQVKRTQEHILSLNKEYNDPADIEADIQAFRTSRSTDASLQREEEEVCIYLVLLYMI